MRPIDADALEFEPNEEGIMNGMQLVCGNDTLITFSMMKDAFQYMIQHASTLYVEPVRHGHWVRPFINKYGHPCHCCSECGFEASQQDKNYCPDCGAKMEVKTNVL